MKKEELTREDKISILNKNVDIIYKFCHTNKEKYRNDFENFEDFISECIILAYDNIDKWDYKRGVLSTYLYNTLPWQLKNAKNRDKNVRAESLDEITDYYENVVEYDNFEDDLVDKMEDERILKLVIPMLHDFTRMKYLEGKNYDEIAEISGRSPYAVKQAIYKNLSNIKKKVLSNED